jgi:hypothetical protein
VTERKHTSALSLLLNVGHAIDHMLLLIFATAVGAIAADFGFARWEDLMPYSVGAFFLFGLARSRRAAGRPVGPPPDDDHLLHRHRRVGGAGRGMQTAWQLAIALTVLGAFSSIYHPVGIPMLVQNAKNPG